MQDAMVVLPSPLAGKWRSLILSSPHAGNQDYLPFTPLENSASVPDPYRHRPWHTLFV